MRGMLLLGCAALTIAAPAWAGDKAELACVQKGYTAEQTAQVDGLLAKVNILAEGEDPAMDALGMLVMGVASECMTRYDWSDAEIEPALLYEFGRLMEVGFRRHGSLAASEIAQIDAALGRGDRTSLWAALEEQLAIGMAGQTDSVSDANAEVFGLFIMETGIGLDEAKGEQVGVYLAAKAMQRASARQFTAAN
ncbi:MAG: hypothetical protein KAF27_06145 [Porphyrobacter sp.]|nr:hypothetical protein [Porphyrobacter sp.]